MKKNIQSILLCGTALLSAYGVKAQTNPVTPAMAFNVFLENGATLTNNETEGPIAIGGDLNVNAGYQVSIHSTGTFMVGGVHVSLVVGGKVNYLNGNLQIGNSGYVKIGNCIGSTMWYTDPNNAYPPIRITPGSNYNASSMISLSVSSNTIGVSASVNPICQGGLINFTSAFTQMRSYSTSISTMTDNATITTSGGTPLAHTGLPGQVKINLHTGVNVLNITGADLNAVTDFVYNNAPDANHVMIFNVNAGSSFTWHPFSTGGVGFSQCPYIMYNFYNTTALNIGSGNAVEGTVYAPYADITKTSNASNVEGQVIAKSYNHGGGENHYAIFAASLSGLSATTATVAAFGVNTTTQCLSTNSYTFTNSSTGTAPFTYTWSFGDGTTSTVAAPSHVYSATGTFNVKLVVNGAGGADSVTHAVTVAGTPVSGYTINNNTQALTGNSFIFTSNAPVTGNTYSWSFGDGTTSTDANPVKSYSAAGCYTVSQTVSNSGGCSVTVVQTVVVEADAVGGGSGGGLESTSLGDLVAQREISRIKNSINPKTDYSVAPVFVKGGFNALAKGTAAATTLQRLAPASLDASTVARVTTPADLTTITKAVDVFSVDFVKNNNAKAVVLGIATIQNAYNHTKSICDRFRGAILTNTEVVTIQGYKFIQFQLTQHNGDIEYCVAFAAGKSAGSTKFNLQSKWLISEYAGDDSVFNFQVWATIPASAQKLAGDILTNLAAIMPLQQTDVNFTLPPAYITYGKRHKENLDIAITSNVASNNAKVVFIEKLNEMANTDSLVIPFNLAAGSNNTFSIPIKDGYEYEGHFYLNDTLADDVYMADGNYSLDYDGANTTIVKYKPGNNANRIYADDEFPLYRNVQVNASTNDYISIYKFIIAGQEKVDLSAYHSYKFFAKGKGTVEIRLIKDGIVKFANQYMDVIELDPAGKNYQLSFDDFTSDNQSEPFTANDVKAVVYTFKMDGKPTDFSFFADEQSFSPTAVTSVKALNSKKVTIAPNPASGQFQCSFASEEERDMDITLTDITGALVYTQKVHAVIGNNTATVAIPRNIAQSILMVQIGNKNVKYGVTKLTVLR